MSEKLKAYLLIAPFIILTIICSIAVPPFGLAMLMLIIMFAAFAGVVKLEEIKQKEEENERSRRKI